MKAANGKGRIVMIGDQKLARSLLNAIGDAVIAFGPDAKIESVNDAAEHIFGYSNGELAGMDVGFLFPQIYRADLYSWFDGIAEAGAPGKLEISALRKHVTPFMAEVSLGLARHDRPLFVMTVRDISDVKKTLRRNARQIERDIILRDTAAMLQDDGLQEALRACLSQIADHYWFTAAHCWRVRDNVLESCGVWVGEGLDDLRDAVLREKIERGRDLAGQAWLLHHTLFVDDMSELDYVGHRDLLTSSGMRALYTIPVTYNGKITGIMQFYNPMPARLEGDDEEFLCQMGDQMGRALHHANARHSLTGPLQTIENLVGQLRHGPLNAQQAVMVQSLESSATAIRKILDAPV